MPLFYHLYQSSGRDRPRAVATVLKDHRLLFSAKKNLYQSSIDHGLEISFVKRVATVAGVGLDAWEAFAPLPFAQSRGKIGTENMGS